MIENPVKLDTQLHIDSQVPTSKPPASKRPTILFVEGMRGVAALAVLFYHAYHAVDKSGSTGAHPHVGQHIQEFLFGHVLSIFSFGAFAVQVFIVISGFCLMLPVAVSPEGLLPGGWKGFFTRRARRILPPYYVALALSLILYVVLGFASQHVKMLAHVKAPPVTMGQILSHVFLIQNLSPAWRFSIDGPMWSVAVESQIYLLFPTILLPVWRRFGNWAALAVAVAIGMAPYLFIKLPFYTHFVGLFAFGMLAALFAYSKRDSDVRVANQVPWSAVTLILLAIVIYRNEFKPDWLVASWKTDTFIGLMTACFLVWCSRADKRRIESPLTFLLRLFESKIAIFLGAFSYSIYLIHHPIVLFLSEIVQRFHFAPATSFVALVAISLPLSLGAAYIFYLYVEKPSMSKTAAERIKREQAIITSPTPDAAQINEQPSAA